ncbi:MAG: hypothetical protein ACO3LH_07975 [Steroidobacteraceae bacterium]
MSVKLKLCGTVETAAVTVFGTLTRRLFLEASTSVASPAMWADLYQVCAESTWLGVLDLAIEGLSDDGLGCVDQTREQEGVQS